MSESYHIQLGEALPLSITLPDAATGLFPQAVVYDSADVQVAGSPFDLPEVGATGRYADQPFTSLVLDTFVALFIVYADAAHLIELTRYERSQDSFVVEIADDALVDLIWDEVLTGATHNVINSAGRRLRQLADRGIITDGIAQAGAPTSIDLAASESAVDDEFNDYLIGIVGGTGSGQLRLILDYTGATRRAAVHRPWIVTPDATSEYVIGLLGASAILNDATRFAGARIDEAISAPKTLTAAERNSIATALLDLAGAADGNTLREFLRLSGAVLLGKLSGSGTATEVFRAIDDSKVRVTVTNNAAGDRLTIVFDKTA